ncbi:unnamed protein product [Mytilus edulis]|uniref:Exonuclease domain-containing protein n=1 Tax=Mytilus edulis TaxID=6550 RepID=A0A8S3PYI4_MYTED|nr:unnamed protein product [Mytilus edulis]
MYLLTNKICDFFYVADCDRKEEKRAKSGHRCQFRADTHKYADSIGFWKVEFKDVHDMLITACGGTNRRMKATQTSVNKKSLLSPGHLTILHGIRKDQRRKQIRKTQSTTNFKRRKRLTIKSKKLKDNQRESVKEGDTYGGEIEVQEHIDTETIPSKMKFGGEESVVVFDLETTGLSRKSDITQLAAFDGTTVFNEYVSPREVISPKSSEITGLTFDFSCDQMYHHGKPVKSRDIQIVLLEFIDFISKKKKPILFGHNIASFDIPILMNKLRQHSLLSEFMLHIYGCIDTIKLARRKFKTKDIGNHKQQTLVTKLLGVEYDAHNACADVTSLFQLLEHFEYSEKDVFPFNSALLTDSYIPLIRASRITKLTARHLAHSGLCLKHLQLAFNRDISRQQLINSADEHEDEVLEYIRSRPTILAQVQITGILSETEVPRGTFASVRPDDLVNETPKKPLNGWL